jgi:hypothetical protein
VLPEPAAAGLALPPLGLEFQVNIDGNLIHVDVAQYWILYRKIIPVVSEYSDAQ